VTNGDSLHAAAFVHDGRGPELRRVHWGEMGTVPLAIDYFNPGDTYDEAHLKHVRFLAPQVVMITPEEVIGPEAIGDLVLRHPGAAMFDRGRSPWLASCSQKHLGKCRHFQLLFYDELIDVIAEGVEVRQGGFREAG